MPRKFLRTVGECRPWVQTTSIQPKSKKKSLSFE